MAKCKDYARGKTCPAFYEVKEAGLVPTGGGWRTQQIGGKEVVCCRPGTLPGKKKTMDQFCYYCTATPMGKKIGSKAGWTGSTPKWCPLGREGT